MTTLYTSPAKSDHENVQEAIKVFPFLSETTAMNVVLWLKERPSMSGAIDESELNTLQGSVWQ